MVKRRWYKRTKNAAGTGAVGEEIVDGICPSP